MQLKLIYGACPSPVHIAEWTTHRIQNLPYGLYWRESLSHIDGIIQSGIRSRREVCGTVDDKRAVFRIQILPRPEQTINRCMVEVERWVSGGGIEILPTVLVEFISVFYKAMRD